MHCVVTDRPALFTNAVGALHNYRVLVHGFQIIRASCGGVLVCPDYADGLPHYCGCPRQSDEEDELLPCLWFNVVTDLCTDACFFTGCMKSGANWGTTAFESQSFTVRKANSASSICLTSSTTLTFGSTTRLMVSRRADCAFA